MKRSFFLALVVLLVSCGQVNYKDVRLDPTPVISKGIGWILVTVSWVRLKTEASYGSEDFGFARRKDIVEVIGRARKYKSPDTGVWYRIKTPEGLGWIHESSVQLYDSKVRALKAQEVLE